MSQNIVSTGDLYPEGREPADLGELTDGITREIATGRRAALRIALLIAHARDAYFPENASEWLGWAREKFGYQRRFVFQCLTAGRLLLSDDLTVHHGALAACDLRKLEKLGTLHAAKPEQCRALLGVWNPAEHSREEVGAKVDAFLAKGPAICDACGGEFERTRKKQTLCEECEARKQQEKAKRKARSADRILGDIAGLEEEQKQQVAAELAPGVAMRAGLCAIEMAFMSVDKTGCWSPDDYARWEPRLAEVVDSFRYLASK